MNETPERGESSTLFGQHLSRAKNAIEIRVRGIREKVKAHGDATVSDLAMSVFVFVAMILILSYIYNTRLQEQVDSADSVVRSLSSRNATLEQQLHEADDVLRSVQRDGEVPHPIALANNDSIIGRDSRISWSYRYHDQGKYIGYVVELTRRASDDSNDPCQSSDGHSSMTGCQPFSQIITATDPGSQQTSVSPDRQRPLQSGSYWWRVAAIQVDHSLNAAGNGERVSDWSTYGSFSLYDSTTSRIIATHHVRVGTNLEQNTLFSRYGPTGGPTGLDLVLARALIEHCLRIAGNHIAYSSETCDTYLRKVNIQALTNASPSLAPSQCLGEQLCADFVQVRQWGNWEDLLRKHGIDIFVGAVTKAAARERGGIKFTAGYVLYHTGMWALRADVGSQPVVFHLWNRLPRTVGVIRDSTNDQFVSLLARQARISVVRVSAYPDLEDALDSGRVDAIVIDDTFVQAEQRRHWDRIVGWDHTTAWHSYLRDYIGADVESIGMAVAEDSDGTLLPALNEALNSEAVQQSLIPQLCADLWGRANCRQKRVLR